MHLKVGITYNLKKELVGDLPEDYYAEFDDEETVDAIAEAIDLSGFKVVKIEADEDAYYRLKEYKPHVVFNIAEGVRGESRKDTISFPRYTSLKYCTPYKHLLKDCRSRNGCYIHSDEVMI